MPRPPSVSPRRTSRPGAPPCRRSRPAVSAAIALALALAPAAPLRAQSDPTPSVDAEPKTEVCGEVTIAALQWPAAEIAAELLAILLRDGHGCAAAIAPAETAQALAAMTAEPVEKDAPAAESATGDAETADRPRPPILAVAVARDAVETAGAARPDALRAGAAVFEARERSGWFVPAWFAAANPQIRTLADAVAAAPRFLGRGASPADGKPTLLLCPPHWPCAKENRALVAELGAANRFRVVEPKDGAELLASLETAQRVGEPWIGYLWTPSAAAARAPVVRLEIGDVRICAAAGRCRPPFDAAPLITAYERRFADRAPRAAAVLQRFSIPPERLREALALQVDAGAGAGQAAEAILAGSPELLEDWLDPAARARFAQTREDRARKAAETPAKSE